MVQLHEKTGVTLIVAYATSGLSQVASQAFFILVFRFLPVGDVGIYSWAIAVASIYTYVMNLGLTTFLVVELSSKVFRLYQVLLAVAIVRFPALILGWGLLQAWVWVSEPSRMEYQVVAVVILTYFVQLVESGILPWLQVRQQQNAANALGLVLPMGRLLGIVILWFGHNATLWNIVMLVFVMQGVEVLCFVLFAFYDAHRPANIDGLKYGVEHLLREFWKRGPKLTVMYLAMALQSRLDWLLVSSLLSNVALANYSLANKVLEFGTTLVGIGTRTTFPWQSRLDADGPVLKSRLGLVRRVFALTSILLGVGLFFWSPTLARWFFGDKYLSAEGAMRLMSIVSIVFMLNQYLLYTVLAKKMEKEYTPFVLLATLIQILVDLVLVPHLGIEGAAWGMLAMGIVVHIAQMGLLLRENVFEGSEMVRLEASVLCSVGIITILEVITPNHIFSSFVSLFTIGLLGSFVVLKRDDWAQFSAWSYEALTTAAKYSARRTGSGLN